MGSNPTRGTDFNYRVDFGPRIDVKLDTIFVAELGHRPGRARQWTESRKTGKQPTLARPAARGRKIVRDLAPESGG